jgi:hypothetical protein
MIQVSAFGFGWEPFIQIGLCCAPVQNVSKGVRISSRIAASANLPVSYRVPDLRPELLGHVVDFVNSPAMFGGLHHDVLFAFTVDDELAPGND